MADDRNDDRVTTHPERTGNALTPRESTDAPATESEPVHDTRRYEDFYVKLRRRLDAWLRTDEGRRHRWADVVCLAPDLVHLLIRLVLDPRVPNADKSRLLAVLLYFLSPLDALPEVVLGPAGYLDDIALAAYALNGLLNRIDPQIVRDHWAGDGDVLEVIQSILRRADEMIGSGLWQRLRRRLSGPSS